jgi:hypothetical protein
MLGYSTANESGMAQRNKRMVLFFNFVVIQLSAARDALFPYRTVKSERCAKQRVSLEESSCLWRHCGGC